MKCPNCKNTIPISSKFCEFCGTQIHQDTTETTQQYSTTSGVPGKNKSTWQTVVTFIVLIVSYGVGRALGLTFFLLVVGWFVGYWFAKWFIKTHAESKFFPIVAWLNIISWISPIFGFLTAGITYVFAEQNKQTKYYILWILAIILATGNALAYPYVTGQ